MSTPDPELAAFREKLKSYKYKSIGEYSLGSQKIEEYLNSIPSADVSYGTTEIEVVYPVSKSEIKFYKQLSKNLKECKAKLNQTESFNIL